MKKNKGWSIACIVCGVLILAVSIWAVVLGPSSRGDYSDGVIQVDPSTIKLQGSGTTVRFSDVILSSQHETRKLIVSEQTGTIDFTLTDSMIKALNVSWLERNQKVSYTGKGYFVVNLDKISADDIVENAADKTVTIKIDHTVLETVDIDPEQVKIDDPERGILAWGEIRLTVSEYNAVEKEIKSRMVEQFNTAENGQKADELALEMVKQVYEPVVTAVNSSYTVNVQFK